MGKRRDESFDFIKGVLIILVVWGHVCAFSSGNGYDKNALTTYIRLFQMPVFVFISGYFQKDIKMGINELLKYFFRQFFALGIPFLFFCLLAILSNRAISVFLQDAVALSLGSFWFFPCIIICKVLASVVLFTVANKWVRYAIFAAIATVFFFVDIDLFYFSFLWIFFALGLVFRLESVNPIAGIKKYIEEKNKKFYAFLGLLTIFVLFLGYIFPTKWTFYIKSNYILNSDFSTMLKTGALVLCRYVIYFLASAWAVCIFTLLENILRKRLINKLASVYEIGSKTLFIYGMHMVLLKYIYEPLTLILTQGRGVVDNEWVRYYIFATAVTMLLLYTLLWVSRLFHKIPIVRTITLGELGSKLTKYLSKRETQR